MQPNNNDIIINNDINNNQNNNQIEDNINYIQAKECRYIDYLTKSEKSIYEYFLNKGCCGSGSNKMTVTLLVYSVIIIIFTIIGIFFRISNNEGYKEYKAEIEKALNLVDTNLPDISEMEIILNLSKLIKDFDKSNYRESYYFDYYSTKEYGKNCSYELFRIGLCTWYDYRSYCNLENYYNDKCNLVEYYVHYIGDFICTYEDYSKNYCSYQQYIDYTNGYLEEFIYYGGKPKRFDIVYHISPCTYSYYTFNALHGISFLKFWCDIGKYDITILLSLFIIMIIFITLLIVDLFIIKVNISLGVLYYTIIILYMIFYLVFRIFIFLLFCLLVYSIVVTSSAPKFEAKTSSLFDYRGYYYLKYNYNK